MRPIYALLFISLNYSLRIFYRERISINKPRKRHSGTIYVSNHPNSFMDPLVIGIVNHAVVRFMTRSDVFKWWLKPVLWASNMLPIFRQHDGADTRSANSDSFKKVNDCLGNGGNILIFGEGFTDDVAIRSLKPVKKGAIRMGFQAVESFQWKKDIYVAPIGVNYSDRHTIGSDIVISNDDPIRLNDYREKYLAHPSKVINELTKRVESGMQSSIIYVADKAWTGFHENVMRLTGKGFNHETRDVFIPLKDRWLYGKNLAAWLNTAHLNENEGLQELRKETDNYFALLKRMKVPVEFVPDKTHPDVLNRSKELTYLLLMWPFAILGLAHGFIPYFIAKTLTEKMFGRKVFWGSVKMMLAKFIGALYNIAIIIICCKIFGISGWFGLAYFFIIPLFCKAAYSYARSLKRFSIKGKMKKQDLGKFIAKKNELIAKIKQLIPVA